MEEAKARRIKQLIDDYDRIFELREAINNCSHSFTIDIDSLESITIRHSSPEYDAILEALTELVNHFAKQINEME